MPTGHKIEKIVPLPGELLQVISPLRLCVTILYTICIPSPLPPEPLFVVKNGSNILSLVAAIHAYAIV